MYRYTEFDRQFVRARAAQFRDQLRRHRAGELSDDELRPLRVQNGWYIQRHAPMLRIAVPYGELSARQLRMLAHIAREHDLRDAGSTQERGGYGHFTTRHNLQFNWIPLSEAADVMDKLAEVDMHGIQTSGNCIRNITTDAWAGIAPDEEIDPRPYAEILRQWSTLHPEFAFLPRKFKIAIHGAAEDRAAILWHDIGLQLHRNADGEVGFRVFAGGGMGRTPLIAPLLSDFVPWAQILVYIEAIVRVYNLHGRRDNAFKARIKILIKAEGQRFIDQVNAEFAALLADDALAGGHLIPQSEFDRIAACFPSPPPGDEPPAAPTAADAPLPYRRWLARNVHAHRLPGYRAVTLSLKRPGQSPGDVTAAQMEAAADLADAFSQGELRVSHDQNLVLPWVSQSALPQLWERARAEGFATPNIGLLTDMITCPGGDLCALANARSLPIAAALTECFSDLEHLEDIGDIDLHISGCINSCGHHHSGHIGILGVDKDGSEWFQVTVGGADGSRLSGPATPGRVIGPAFAADEIPDVVQTLVDLALHERAPGERFVDTIRRLDPRQLRQATDAVRQRTAHPATA